MFDKTTIWTGNTYAIRSQIQAFGGKWDAANKCWIVPALNRTERVQAERLRMKSDVEVIATK